MAALSSATILTSRLENSVVARTFGGDVALDRLRRFGRSVYAAVNPMASLDDFLLHSSLSYAQITDSPILYVVFFTQGVLHLHVADQISADTLGLGWPQPLWCALDLVDPEPWLIVPSRLFTPFEGTKRSEITLRHTDMMPIFFRRSDGGVGVHVAADADYDTIPETPTRISAKSLKVILSLRNYSTDERQIQLRCPANATVSARRLARLVATKVRNCIEKADRENATMVHWKDPRWKFGAGVDCIKVGDIILLGIVFVSPGKVTPLLKLRSDYPFHF